MGILDRLRDVEKVEALRNGHRAGIDIAAHDTVVNRGKRRRLNELVFSRLQRAPAHHMPKIESITAADNAVLGKQSPNGRVPMPGATSTIVSTAGLAG